ncbi:MAG: sodium:solute symporter family protein [Clostridiales Family XIII bacterium]|jgi:sodium/pantothenate symporter|nr:sodium:solute symporter family protein [Clostridiales Family XIII bacterium]
MNIPLLLIFISIATYVVVGLVVGRNVKSTEDYYVSGRRMPTFLIVGSLVASMLSTTAFMGETGWSYSGNFVNEIVINAGMATGIGFGVVMFGRFLRRAETLTMPEYFGKRFDSVRMQRLAGIITVLSITCYLLAVTTGVGVLLSELTGLNIYLCYLLSFGCFVSFTFYSGSNGVIIADTIMFCVFLLGTFLSAPYLIEHGGGFGDLIQKLMENPHAPEGLLAFHGNIAGTGASDAFGAVTYTIIYTLVWFIVTGISPWQAGRHMMAKSEHVAIRAGVIGAAIVSALSILLHISAISLINVDPGLVPERAMVWGFSNLVPVVIGSIALAGIMAAGLSSAATFLSIVGFSITNDVYSFKFRNDRHKLVTTRIVMLVVGAVAFALACSNVGGIRIVTWLASTLIAASWCVVAFAGVWSKKLTARGAFWSMLAGFLGFLVTKVLFELGIVTVFHNFLDPFFVGIYLSVLFAILGSMGQKKSETEELFYEKMHITPQSELVPSEVKRTKLYCWVAVVGGVVITAFLIIYWVAPYNGWL